MSRQSARSGLRPDQKPPELSRPWEIIVVVSGEVYLSLHANWQTVGTYIFDGGTNYFLDGTLSQGIQFYRAHLP
jgi:hypothetical protein